MHKYDQNNLLVLACMSAFISVYRYTKRANMHSFIGSGHMNHTCSSAGRTFTYRDVHCLGRFTRNQGCFVCVLQRPFSNDQASATAARVSMLLLYSSAGCDALPMLGGQPMSQTMWLKTMYSPRQPYLPCVGSSYRSIRSSCFDPQRRLVSEELAAL